MDRYFSQFQPWITQQPKKRSDIAPSVFEYNLAMITDAAERDAEWNATGLGSGLNPIVSTSNRIYYLLLCVTNLHDINRKYVNYFTSKNI
jgi:hypothetical protein